MKTDADKLRSFLKQITPIIETYGKKNIISEIDKSIITTEDSTTVLFCGEFKRGKSSLVNAIVGAELCPTDTGIATSVVTTIKYGAIKKAVRYYGNLLEDVDALKSEEIEWDDIKKYTMGDVLEIDNTILVELSYPSPFLKGGITIIDTPGIGGLDPRHAILAHMALPKADVIVFVTDTGEPLTASEKNFYINHVLPCNKPNLVLVNKSDELIGDVLQGHLNKVKLEFVDLSSPQIIPVSSRYWNRYVTKPDEKYLIRSNKDAVLAGIALEVETYRKSQYKLYRDMIVAELETVFATISLEIQQLEQDSADKLKTIEDLQRQLTELNKFRGDLNNPTSSIRLQINSIFEDARNEVQNVISHEGTILTSSEFDTLLESERGIEYEGKWFIAQINDRLRKLSQSVDNRIERGFGEISKTIGREITNVINEEAIIVSNELKKYNRNIAQFSASVSGKLMQGSLLGTLTGGVVGFAIPALATTLAPIVGLATIAAFIWKGMKTESDATAKMHLRQQILPKVQLAITDLRNQTNTRFTKFHQNLLVALQAIIEDIEEKMKVLQKSIQESRVSEHEGKEKISELEKKLKFCETIISQMKLLYSNPFTNA